MSYLTPDFKAQLRREVENLYQQVVKDIAGEGVGANSAVEIINRTAFIDKLLDILKRYNDIIALCWENNSDVKTAYNSTLGAVVNKEIPGVRIRRRWG